MSCMHIMHAACSVLDGAIIYLCQERTWHLWPLLLEIWIIRSYMYVIQAVHLTVLSYVRAACI